MNSKIKIFSIIGILFAGILLVAESCSDDDEPKPIELSCNSSLDTSNLDNYVAVDMTLTNNLGRDIYYLDRHNPFSKDDEAFFEVTNVAQTKDYNGFVYSYQNPTKADFTLLKKGDSLTVKYPLSEYYDFAQAGSFDIKPQVDLKVLPEAVDYTQLGENPETESIELACPQMQLSLEEGVARSELVAKAFQTQPRLCTRYTQGFPRTACKPQYSSACNGFMNVSQFDKLHQSMWRTVATSTVVFDNNPALVTKWFGGIGPAMQDDVKGDLGSIRRFFNNQKIHYYCLPSDSRCYDSKGAQNVIAFVYPSLKFADIHLCSVFRTLPDGPKGGAVKTKMGTLVHEAAHLPGVYADDVTYGRYWSSILAQHNPLAAVRNADNFQFFYEDSQ